MNLEFIVVYLKKIRFFNKKTLRSPGLHKDKQLILFITIVCSALVISLILLKDSGTISKFIS